MRSKKLLLTVSLFALIGVVISCTNTGDLQNGFKVLTQTVLSATQSYAPSLLPKMQQYFSSASSDIKMTVSKPNLSASDIAGIAVTLFNQVNGELGAVSPTTSAIISGAVSVAAILFNNSFKGVTVSANVMALGNAMAAGIDQGLMSFQGFQIPKGMMLAKASCMTYYVGDDMEPIKCK